MSKTVFSFQTQPFLSLCATLLLAAVPVGSSSAQTAPPAAETYRLRVENTQYGRVEMSADNGAHYVLIGRTLHPAAKTVGDKLATTPGIVLRSGRDGLAFVVAPGQILKLRPRTGSPPLPGRKSRPRVNWPRLPEPPDIVTNLEAGQGVFGSLAPPFRSIVRLETGPGYLAALPEAFAPTEDDVFVFLVTLPVPPPAPNSPPLTDEQRTAAAREAIRQQIAALGKTYADTALARARAEKRDIVSGTLTLQARLPKDEPDPIAAVTFAVDDNVVAAQNTPPFTHAWDTRQTRDGEHVVEIRALNMSGRLITRARALVVVANAP